MPFKAATRLPAFDYTGPHRYSLTICVRHRRPVFVTDADVGPILLQIVQTAEDHGFAVIAYCFMPDHLHLLVEGQRQDSDLRDFVRQFKQRTAFAWKRIHGDALWQRGYFDHVLRDEEDALRVARYILANPVRAGLVDAPEAYSFSGSLVMERRDLLASI